MSETAPVYRADPYRSWEEGDDLDRYAADLRAARGVPTESAPGRPGQANAYRPMPVEPDYDGWEPADVTALRAIQDMASMVLCDDFNPKDLDWIVEETLFQVYLRLSREGRLRLPQIGTLELAHDDRGRSGRLTLARALREARP